MTEQTLAMMRARNKAYRWPKGVSGNPGGQAAIYHHCRKLARDASLDMMRGLIDLARNAEDERVRSVGLIAVLDRAGVRPIDKPEAEPDRDDFDPRAYSPEELARIEEALLLVVDPARARRMRGEDAQEVLPPGDR